MGSFGNIEHPNVLDMSRRELLDYLIKTNSMKSTKFLPEEKIMVVAKECFKILGLECNNEGLTFILDRHKYLLCEALAGGGKTSLAVFRAYFEIMVYSTNHTKICMTTFSVKAKNHLISKYTEIKKKLLPYFNQHARVINGSTTRHINEAVRPDIRTINSLCDAIVKDYRTYFGLTDFEIISNSDNRSVIYGILSDCAKTFGEAVQVSDNFYEDFKAYYDNLNERMENVEDTLNRSTFSDLGLKREHLEYIVQEYRKTLCLKGMFNHSDAPRMIVEKCRESEEFRNIVKNLFYLIVIDEAQDVSESMFGVILYLTAGVCRLIMIGDGDQAIYGFRGAKSDICLRFLDYFNNASICKLSINRRSCDEIIRYSDYVIKHCKNRRDKLLLGTGKNGFLKQYNFVDSDSQMKIVSNILKYMTIAELSNCAISYRQNNSCYHLIEELEKNDIPFRVDEKYLPGNDILSTNLRNILDILASPADCETFEKYMNRILPIPSKAFKLEKEVDEQDVLSIFDLDLTKIKPENIKGRRPLPIAKLQEYVARLEPISESIRYGVPLKDIMGDLIQIFKECYWNLLRTSINFDENLEQLIFESFYSDLSYDQFKGKHLKRLSVIRKNNNDNYGVLLTTMHSEKGLEHDTVIIMDLDYNNFPSIRYTENMCDEEMENELDSEIRLFYVACTRARTKLYQLWKMSPQSSLISLSIDAYNNVEIEETTDNDNILKAMGLNLNELIISGKDCLTGTCMEVSLDEIVDDNDTNLQKLGEIDIDLSSLMLANGGIDVTPVEVSQGIERLEEIARQITIHPSSSNNVLDNKDLSQLIPKESPASGGEETLTSQTSREEVPTLASQDIDLESSVIDNSAKKEIVIETSNGVITGEDAVNDFLNSSILNLDDLSDLNLNLDVLDIQMSSDLEIIEEDKNKDINSEQEMLMEHDEDIQITQESHITSFFDEPSQSIVRATSMFTIDKDLEEEFNSSAASTNIDMVFKLLRGSKVVDLDTR